MDEQVRLRLTTVRSGQMFLGLCSQPEGPAACAVIAAVGVLDAKGVMPLATSVSRTPSPPLRFETRTTEDGELDDPSATVISKVARTEPADAQSLSKASDLFLSRVWTLSAGPGRRLSLAAQRPQVHPGDAPPLREPARRVA